MQNIAGVVILYNPGPDIIDNIKSYLPGISMLYLIDNSEIPVGKGILQSFDEKRVEYIAFNKNLGIGTALNIAARKAIANGFDWLLTMDQDSVADQEMIHELWSSLDSIDYETTAILAPQYLLPTTITIHDKEIEEVTTVITSGNLLNLNAYKIVGEFREDFFIDYIDHEYCLRLKTNGYKIYINYKALLYHRLGNTKQHGLVGKTFSTTHHNYLRRYYITRNRLATLNSYHSYFPDYCKEELKNQFKETIKVILFETDKYRKLKSILKGYIDYKSNKLGKY